MKHKYLVMFLMLATGLQLVTAEETKGDEPTDDSLQSNVSSSSEGSTTFKQRLASMGQEVKTQAFFYATVAGTFVEGGWQWMKNKAQSAVSAVKGLFSKKDSSDSDTQVVSSIPALDPTDGSIDTPDDSF